MCRKRSRPNPRSPVRRTRAAYHQRLLDGVAALPGVTGVALVNQIPLDGCCAGAPIFPEGATANSGAVPASQQRNALLAVSPDYLRTMRIPLRAGRFLTAQDGRGSDDVLFVVINETAARTYWPDRHAVRARYPPRRSEWYALPDRRHRW